jgi:hypothetical protein
MPAANVRNKIIDGPAFLAWIERKANALLDLRGMIGIHLLNGHDKPRRFHTMSIPKVSLQFSILSNVCLLVW